MEISASSFPHELLLILITSCIALQSILLWSCATSQETGFLSIDCGSVATSLFTDPVTAIQWISDSDQINLGGTPITVSGKSDPVLSTMRLFNGSQTKNCYSLTNSAVQEGAFFLVRASFWAGLPPPYMPQNVSDGNFLFKLIVDADEWMDVRIPGPYTGTTDWWSYEVYVRAQGSSINMCLARSTPTGDAPFINALELRPLPATLTSTSYMNRTNRLLVVSGRNDYGVPSSGPSDTRYPYDSLDRLWLSYIEEDSHLISTNSAIDVTDLIDQPPARILQNSYTASPSYSFSINDSSLDPNSLYIFVEFYFAEINPNVNASGQRTFDLSANGVSEVLNTEGAIDVFAAVGARTAYSYSAEVSPKATGVLVFEFTATTTSIFLPFVAAGEFFNTKAITAVTTSTVVSTVEEIKTNLSLSRFTGDPCLPAGYGYSWLTCSGSGISALNLSNYDTGGKIPSAINLLTALTEVHLDGNALQGEIPDLSNLTNLETLDLSNNKLSGSIPSFLATLKNLKVLYLQNNNLSGEIPANLLQRKKASELTFEFSGNSLCETSNAECSNPSPSQSNKKSNTAIIIGVVVVGILLVGIAIGVMVYYLCLKKLSRMKVRTDRQQAFLDQELPRIYETPNSGIKVVPKRTVKEFTFQEIRDATSNFCTKLGQGGFGPVYEGLLEDGRLVAVKVSSRQSHEGSREFLNEVDLLSRVHHKNLVGLLGYCSEEKLILVYEFMSNGSLFDCLHGPYSKASPLSWATRLHILVDAAQGLDYLHHGCSPPIIHRDVKSSNILLNDNNQAKISDFGISRDYMRNETGAPPTTLVGSMGYMDPEYLSSMMLTEKVDVYSFGVLLFEVVCGKRAVFQDSSQPLMNLVDWAKAFINRGVIDAIVDASLHGQFDIESVWKVVEVALACLEMPSSKRPKMSDVYLELREAKRMELESEERDAIDKPSVELTDGTIYNTLLYNTNVSTR